MSVDREPFSPDFRYETIVRTIKQIANDELKWKERGTDDLTPEAWNTIMEEWNKFGQGTSVFTNPQSTQAEKDAVESATFAAIMYLKAVDVLTPALSQNEIMKGIAKIETQQDALSVLMKEILIVLSDVLEVVKRLDRQ